MSGICEDCAPLVFDRYGDGREVQPQGVALCPLHATTAALLTALENLLTASYAHGPRAVTEAREAREAARAALRAAKGEQG